MYKFHRGEKSLQEKTGERSIAQRNERYVSDSLSVDAAAFVSEKKLVNIAISDASGDLWSYFISGEAGFIVANSVRQVTLIKSQIVATSTFWTIIAKAEAEQLIGMMIIDLTSVQRMRINGRIKRVTENEIIIDIEEVCPNCPKYIQQRKPAKSLPTYPEFAPLAGTNLSQDVIELIQRSDTFYVASRHASGGHDASHRGGDPGFVNVEGNTLIIPDYMGNSMFMTLGNFVKDATAGIAFVDFDAGSQLNLTGSVEIKFDDSTAHDGTTGRYWMFTVKKWLWEPFHPQQHWELVRYSRFNP